jgi:hypothetical protein
MSIKIYEFSTGIKPVGNSENWHSQGFTGEYMNRTIEEIPSAVQEVISDRLFAVAEGGATDQPALIGRDVKDSEGGWSVLAVVTRGRDEWKRPFSAYRYFLCKGKGNLAKIFKWWTQEQLFFNPYDVKNIGDFWEWQGNHIPVPLNKFQHYLNNQVPIILPFYKNNVTEKINELIINGIAQQKAEESKQLVAWAYNVEALEAPRSFQVIVPASEQAEEILKRVIASQPNITHSVQEEQAIKKAISLLSQNKVKSEYLQTIEQGLGNEIINYEYWQTMFDSQGATEAIRNSNYSPQMIRLLTLQAMVLPETLPKFLDWIRARDKKDELWVNCLDFQSEIKKNLKLLPKLREEISYGVKFIIFQLLEHPNRLEITAWLLISENGCWSDLYKGDFRKNLDNDLRILSTQGRILNFNEDQNWKNIFDDLAYLWPDNNNYKFEEYLPLANLFYTTGDYIISALFCYASMGNVPKQLFKKLNPNNNDYKTIYGLKVYRQQNIFEKIGGFIVPVYAFIPALITFLLLGYFGGSYFFPSDAEKSINQTSEYLAEKISSENPDKAETRKNLIKLLKEDELKKSESQKLSKALTCAITAKNTDVTDEYYCNIPEEILKKGVSEFEKTKTNIKSIMEIEESKDPKAKKNFIANDIRNLVADKLKLSQTNFKNIIDSDSNDSEQKKEIVYSIYQYQQSTNSRGQNLVDENGILDEKTKAQLIKSIKPSSPSLVPKPSHSN